VQRNAPPPNKPTFGAWGVDLTGMDKSVKPGDDFFDYANGTWYKNAVIRSDRTATGSFPNLTILSEQRMTEIVKGLETKSQPNAEERKIRDLYDAYTDTAAIEKNGLTPAQKDLAAIAALKTLEDVARAMGNPEAPVEGPFAVGIAADPKEPTRYVATITQSGLGMPNRDYYLKDDPALATTRDAYRKYLATMLTLAGEQNAQNVGARADAVFTLETEIARDQWTAVESRDADHTYNPMTAATLASSAPGFPWTTFLAAKGLSAKGPNGDRILIVRQNTAVPKLAALFAATSVPVWRDYLTVHYLHTMSACLPKAFDDADFDFFGKVLGGQKVQLPRETRAVRLIDQRLGHPLGKIYVAKYFPPESKAKVEALVDNLLKAYDADIRKIPWMTDATKAKALDKLHHFTPHVGYPDAWRDFSGLTIARGDLIGDIERSDAFEWHHRLDRIDRPVDRNEWNMTPPTVNAYYTSTLNSIFFPAAILQPPFFDPSADDAVNYGGIGAVMGHEIGHGFDDQGSKYSGVGKLESWWTDQDRKAFEERVAALGAQYDSYEGVPGLHVNGKLTMGENIGDLSGLAISLQAYHYSLNGKAAPVIDGYTGDQRYFLGFAQIWRSKSSEASIRRQVLSNPHSPSHWRVVGPTRNVDAWYDTFNVKPGDKYYLPPDKRVHLW
ncbi:MAG TPA: M13 family metallopeptidase, partial [Vicinamibacterales bacterium]|nr:M13 family metallopeptidase [Vicinamibacterales bacterium]